MTAQYSIKKDHTISIASDIMNCKQDQITVNCVIYVGTLCSISANEYLPTYTEGLRNRKPQQKHQTKYAAHMANNKAKHTNIKPQNVQKLDLLSRLPSIHFKNSKTSVFCKRKYVFLSGQVPSDQYNNHPSAAI